MWWRGLREELHGVSEAVQIRCDNLSAVHLAKKEVGYSPRSKHIDIRHHFVREKLAQNIIGLEHVRTDEQIADALTKAVPVAKLEDAMTTLGIL
ncbi:hypothetical protein RP20_CCG021658 [Aedes albopictus]|nr:hypothetical protein RP20_CCG021658 [Aedes albopictus]